jgi:hypothetical protein
MWTDASSTKMRGPPLGHKHDGISRAAAEAGCNMIAGGQFNVRPQASTAVLQTDVVHGKALDVMVARQTNNEPAQ